MKLFKFRKRSDSGPSRFQTRSRDLSRTEFLRRLNKRPDVGSNGMPKLALGSAYVIRRLNAYRPSPVSKSVLVPRTQTTGRPLGIPLFQESSRDICGERLQRRGVLFAYGIAGKGLRKSPGQGGAYRPSEGSCERRF